MIYLDKLGSHSLAVKSELCFKMISQKKDYFDFEDFAQVIRSILLINHTEGEEIELKVASSN